MSKEENAKPAAAPTPEKKAAASRPTNCSQCNKRIRRKSWYYRYGKHFCGKNCSKTYWTKQRDEKKKTQESKSAVEAAAAAAPSESDKTTGEKPVA